MHKDKRANEEDKRDNVTEHKVTEDKVTEHKVTEDKVTEDKVTEHKVTEDKVMDKVLWCRPTCSFRKKCDRITAAHKCRCFVTPSNTGAGPRVSMCCCARGPT